MAILAGGITAAQQRGGTLNVALPHEVDTLDPYASGILTNVPATIFEGLVAPDENGKWVAALAQEVPTVENRGIRITDGGTKMVVTYRLRPGLRWADGAAVTSADVRFTWEWVRDPKYLGPEKSGTAEIDRIETPDAQTAVVYYKQVLPGFKASLFTYGLLPRHVLQGKDPNRDPFWEKPFGAGPFRTAEFRRGQFVIVERNPNYWRKDANGTQLPYLDRIVFRMVPAINTIVTQLRSGEVQFAYGIPFTAAPSLDNVPGLKVVAARYNSYRHITFNHNNEFLKDLNVRKAIAHAIDRSAINRALGGYLTPTNTFVHSNYDFSSKSVPAYAYNPERARTLLRQAGFTAGPDGIMTKDGKRLSLKFMSSTGNPEYELSQQVVAAQLKAVGIETVINNLSGPALTTARRTNGAFDLWYSGWITPADPIDSYISFYGTKGANNGSGYSSAKVDQVLNRAASSLDTALVKQYMLQVQRDVANDLAALPLFEAPSMIAYSEKLQNFKPNPTNQTNFREPSAWWLRN